MHFVLFEHGSQGVIAANHSLVVWVLEVVGTHIRPDALDCLRARQLSGKISFGSNAPDIDTHLDFIV